MSKSKTDELLAKASKCFAEGDGKYEEGGRIIAALRDAPHELSYREIGVRLNPPRSYEWVRRVSSARDNDEPINWNSGSNKRDEVARKVLRDPDQRRQVIESLTPEERDEVRREIGRDGAKEAVDASLDVQVARMLTQVSRVEVLLGEGHGFDNLNAKATDRMLSDLDHAESVIGRLRDAVGTHGKVRVVA